MEQHKAIYILLVALSSCSTDNTLAGKWVHNHSPVHDDTLLISKTDSGLICTVPRGTYTLAHYELDYRNSFDMAFISGCFAYDLKYTLHHNVGSDSLIVFVEDNSGGSKPVSLIFRRNSTKLNLAAPTQ